MNIIRTDRLILIGDEWTNDILVTCIENDVFDSIRTKAIMRQFQNMEVVDIN